MSGEGLYHTGWAECHQCRYRWMAILEPGCPGYPLECPECAAMDGEMVKYITPPSAIDLRAWPAEERDQYLRATSEHAVKRGYGRELF